MCQLTHNSAQQIGFVPISGTSNPKDGILVPSQLGKRFAVAEAESSPPGKKLKLQGGGVCEVVLEEEIVVLEEKEGPTEEEKSFEFAQASRSGDIDAIKSFVEAGYDVDCTHIGYSALHCAALYNHKEIVEYLLDQGAHADTQGPSGFTPVAWATDRGFDELVGILLENEADPSIPNKKGITPLHIATKAKNYKMVHTLLSINTETEEWTKVNAQCVNGQTPAYIASFSGSVDILRLLFEYNANMNVASPKNVVPLHRAASQGHEEVVRYLVEEAGATVDFRDANGRTALHLATIRKQIPVIKILLANGANPNMKDNNKQTPCSISNVKRLAGVEDLFRAL